MTRLQRSEKIFLYITSVASRIRHPPSLAKHIRFPVDRISSHHGMINVKSGTGYLSRSERTYLTITTSAYDVAILLRESS